MSYKKNLTSFFGGEFVAGFLGADERRVAVDVLGFEVRIMLQQTVEALRLARLPRQVQGRVETVCRGVRYIYRHESHDVKSHDT